MTGRTLFEFGTVATIVLVVQTLTSVAQDRIAVREGRGFDGVEYYAIARQVRDGTQLTAAGRFGRRLGTPALAALVAPNDLIRGFTIVNVAASFVSSLLLLAWLRLFVRSSWLRIVLVGVFASHWLQLTRFTFFYPVLVDACAQTACFAGLLAIAWYERTPGKWPLLAVSVISATGVFFREIVLLVPIAFLFARNPRLWHSREFPFVRGVRLPGLQWLPLLLSIASLVWIASLVVPRDPQFSAAEHFGDRAFHRSVVTFSLGWAIAYAPTMFLVLYDWRSARSFLWKHSWLLVYVAGVMVIGWVASWESERHALYWAAPIVFALLGRTIERRPYWFRSPGLLAVVLCAQLLVSRAFLPVPQYDEDYRDRSPTMALTALGRDASYLHLFPDYLSYPVAWRLFGGYLGLGAILLFWIGRRAGLSRTSANRDAIHSARKAITGSILVARRAGTNDAHSATSSNVTDSAM